MIRGVVGWVPLTEGAGVKPHLERFAGNHRLRGVRHVIHDEPDPRYILRDDFNAGVAALPEFGLRYDILIFEKHLPAAIEFVDRHPNQIFILDHVAKPRIKERIISPWDRNMREMAKRQNVYCKLSGMVTEADLAAWTPQDLAAVYRCGARGFRTAPCHVRIGLAGAAKSLGLCALVRHGEPRNQQAVEAGAGANYGRNGGGSLRALRSAPPWLKTPVGRRKWGRRFRLPTEFATTRLDHLLWPKQAHGNALTVAVRLPYATMSFTTLPCTSVSRKSRPA